MKLLPHSVRDFFVCFLGWHFVPFDWTFEEDGRVYSGGVCERCRRVKRGPLLGTVRDFFGAEELVKRNSSSIPL